MSDDFYRFQAHKDTQERATHGYCTYPECDNIGNCFCIYCNQRMCDDHRLSYKALAG